MVIIPMVAISMSSLVKKEKIILVTCITRICKERLLHLSSVLPVSKIFEAFKQLARTAFVQNVQLSHIFKRDKLFHRKDPLHC